MIRLFLFPPKMYTRFLLVFGVFINSVRPQEGLMSPCEVEGLLQNLLTPAERNTLQVQALRRNLLRVLDLPVVEVSQNLDDESDYGRIVEEKRSLSSLARTGSLPYSVENSKRNVEALARGGLLKPPPQERDLDDFYSSKRSLATLAKNGQLPNSQEQNFDRNVYLNEEDKRNIGSLARNGLIAGKRNIASLARNYDYPYGKRNIQSLARNGELKRNVESLVRNNMLPNGKRWYYYNNFKRNIGTIARDWSLPSHRAGKRNVATLLRQENYKNGELDDDDSNILPTESLTSNDPQKRNLAALKAQHKSNYGNLIKRSIDEKNHTEARRKRQADYDEDNDESNEVMMPTMTGTNNYYDYDDGWQNADPVNYESPDKRFLDGEPQDNAGHLSSSLVTTTQELMDDANRFLYLQPKWRPRTSYGQYPKNHKIPHGKQYQQYRSYSPKHPNVLSRQNKHNGYLLASVDRKINPTIDVDKYIYQYK